jgi:hypothetical protein
VETGGTFIPQNAIRKYIDWYNRGYMSSVGYRFDVGGATGGALYTWDKFFDREVGIDPKSPTAHVVGQPAIDKILKKEVS